MRLKNILPTTLCVLALSAPAWAGVYATSSETSMPTATDTAFSASPTMLASSGFSPSFISMQDVESGDDLAQAVLAETNVNETKLLSSSKTSQSLELDKQTMQESLMTEQRAGFSLREMFRIQGEPSLFTFFFGMAFIGLMVVGIRLEYLRRKAEHAAFYDYEFATQQRHRRQKSTVVYVQTPEQPRRHRRHRSSHSHGHTSHRRRHRSHQSTHPVTIEGRLAT